MSNHRERRAHYLECIEAEALLGQFLDWDRYADRGCDAEVVPAASVAPARSLPGRAGERAAPAALIGPHGPRRRS